MVGIYVGISDLPVQQQGSMQSTLLLQCILVSGTHLCHSQLCKESQHVAFAQMFGQQRGHTADGVTI